MNDLGLALKAEVVLAVLLMVRHRTVRLAGLLALLLAALASLKAVEGSAASRHHTVVVIAGSLAAVAASRLLAPGAAIAAARRAASPWWVAPVGRLGGMWLLLVPILFITSGFLADDPAQALQIAWVASVYGAAIGALVLALSPVVGASGSGAVGLLAAWLGAIPPSGMFQLLSGWQYVQRPAVVLWNVLPLDWRAQRWARAGGWEDPAVFVIWTAVGLALAAWAVASSIDGAASSREARS